MTNLKIDATEDTPYILLDIDEGKLEIRGKSYPENAFAFYKPILTAVEDYFEEQINDATTIDLEIIYVNSSSLQIYFEFFDLFMNAHQNSGQTLTITWNYDEENEEALELGVELVEEFESLDITLKPHKS
jgi:hypothetical protein